MFIRSLGILIIAITISGCAGTQKYVQKHDPIMDQNGGVVLLVDVCNKIDVVGNNDYCVVNESREGAKELTKGIRTYLEEHGIEVRSEIIPFVCGACDSPDNTPTKVAENIGDDVKESPKPYGVADEIISDPEYMKALTTLSTYAFQAGMIKMLEDTTKKKEKFKRPDLIVNEDQLKSATDIIKEKTNASSILYIGVNGVKISGGKKFAQGLFSFTVGMATAVATAGLGTGYYYTFIPGRKADGMYLCAGLINLETGNSVWKNWGNFNGNPIKPKYIANPNYINLLLKDLVMEQVPKGTSN